MRVAKAESGLLESRESQQDLYLSMTERESNELGDKRTRTVSFDNLSSEMQAMFRKLQLKSKIVDGYHKAHFGHSPPIVSVEAFGRRMVAIGATIVHADDPSYDWETPSDFPVSYLKSTLGINWLDQEFQNSSRDQHEVAKWYVKGVPNLEMVSRAGGEIPPAYSPFWP
jgi:hypothetical protein